MQIGQFTVKYFYWTSSSFDFPTLLSTSLSRMATIYDKLIIMNADPKSGHVLCIFLSSEFRHFVGYSSFKNLF